MEGLDSKAFSPGAPCCAKIPLQWCFISGLELSVVRSIHDGKESGKEELPKHQIHNWRNLDRAAFCDVEDVATEQAHDVAPIRKLKNKF